MEIWEQGRGLEVVTLKVQQNGLTVELTYTFITCDWVTSGNSTQYTLMNWQAKLNYNLFYHSAAKSTHK
jgi:hypothetical protein